MRQCTCQAGRHFVGGGHEQILFLAAVVVVKMEIEPCFPILPWDMGMFMWISVILLQGCLGKFGMRQTILGIFALFYLHVDKTIL